MPLHPQQRINRFEKNFSAYRLIIVVIISCVLMYQDYQKNYLPIELHMIPFYQNEEMVDQSAKSVNKSIKRLHVY